MTNALSATGGNDAIKKHNAFGLFVGYEIDFTVVDRWGSRPVWCAVCGSATIQADLRMSS